MKERQRYVDIAKGIGVLFVILGHMPMIPVVFRNWIFSFHMPLFFFVSGMFHPTKEMSYRQYLRKTGRSLVLPYVIYSAVFLLLDILLLDIDATRITEMLINTVCGQGSVDILWFFISLFIVKQAFYFTAKSRYYRIINIGIITSALCLLSAGIMLPFKLLTSLAALSFYWFGYEVRQYELLSKSLVWIYPTAAAFNLGASIFMISKVGHVMDINHGVYTYGWFSIITGTAGVLAVLGISKLIDRINWISVPLSYIGKNSLYFYPLTSYFPMTIVLLAEKILGAVGILIKLGSKVMGFLVTSVIIEWKTKLFGKR